MVISSRVRGKWYRYRQRVVGTDGELWVPRVNGGYRGLMVGTDSEWRVLTVTDSEWALTVSGGYRR